MFSVDWWSLCLPLAYITVLLGSFFTFSSLSRKRKAIAFASLAPWFPQHLPKNVYLSLLHLEPEQGKEKSPAVPDSILRAALLRRAVEDIRRIIQIRSAKQACTTLLQRGSVGDDLNERFIRAEKDMEEELKDVVQEANALSEGWGNTIFQSANEINSNTTFKKSINEIHAKAPAEKEWWEKKRASIQSEFMKELESEPTTGKSLKSKVGSDEEGIIVEGGGPAQSTGSAKKKNKK